MRAVFVSVLLAGGFAAALVAVCNANESGSEPLDPSKLALLPKECGVNKFGGTSNKTKSLAFEFPWMALVRFNQTRLPATCFGSLVNRRYVLSVIGCIRKTKRDPSYVRLGEQTANTDRDCNIETDELGNTRRDCAGQVLDVAIESYVYHPDFDQPMYTNDVALIRMVREVDYNDYIAPICLPTTPELRASIPRYMVMPAWELDRNEPTHIVGALQKYFVENVDLDTCQRAYERVGFTPDFGDDKRICAQQLGPNYVCSRPAGVPIGTELNLDGKLRHVQFAIAKFAPLNCTVRESVPMISMSVPKYIKWITDHLAV